MQVLNIFHVLIAIALVAFVLIQKGQGATAGAAFGSGASGTVFGSRGAGNFLTRSTWVLATLFCTISLTMAVMVSRINALPENDLGVVGNVQPSAQVEESQIADEVSVTSDEPVVTDMPSFEIIDDTPAASAAEESQAAEEEGSGSGSDDS
ncbi:MAG: preprotein translocase subunit SecG [Xanthomonadales bacterium]|jgi:preprotein translocase subunit SecG|nr:preprotein translocase subunit SecG [Xanthomonadales bacterium]MDH3924600.1 preprotein translocase subunit SecG [Xanthomonadales bacterium]MDH3940186.1 preprotein translocase subunit SecG [Xanthomonadales bacterium]MDH4001178.1 preprotein translocase subunit SecG [Xanthomonadales bacterium]